MVQLTQKNGKSEKNAKNALTSHYANGHGDPCDKWVVLQFSIPGQMWGGLWKIAKPVPKWTWWAVETAN